MEILYTSDRRRQAIEKIRADRTKTLNEIESVGEAPLSLDETVTRYLASLREQAEHAEHQVLAFAHQSIVPALPAFNVGFLLWLGGADFEKQLRARLKPLVPGTAMPQADRAKKVASLRAHLAELDEAEEREICRLEVQGLAVERRIDVELATVLHVWDSPDASAVQS
ncbi:MAG: hypothetical protein WDZ66_03975 [Steroidobacteraceae bacterium]